MRGTENIGGDDFRHRGDHSDVVERTLVGRPKDASGRETDQTGGDAIAAKQGSGGAFTLAALAGAVMHLAFMGGKVASQSRGRERGVDLGLGDQGQDQGA